AEFSMSQMKMLRDLVLEVEDAVVIEAVAQLYEQQKTEWLPDAIADVLAELRRLTPNREDGDYELHIERAVPLVPNEEPAWDVWYSKENDPERYGLDLSPWEKWLPIRSPESLLSSMPAAEIVAHYIWEMTYYGFDQELIAENRAELDRRV